MICSFLCAHSAREIVCVARAMPAVPLVALPRYHRLIPRDSLVVLVRHAIQKGPPVKPGALSSRKSMARETHDRPTVCESRHHQLLSMQALRFISGAPLENSIPARAGAPRVDRLCACCERTIRVFSYRATLNSVNELLRRLSHAIQVSARCLGTAGAIVPHAARMPHAGASATPCAAARQTSRWPFSPGQAPRGRRS